MKKKSVYNNKSMKHFPACKELKLIIPSIDKKLYYLYCLHQFSWNSVFMEFIFYLMTLPFLQSDTLFFFVWNIYGSRGGNSGPRTHLPSPENHKLLYDSLEILVWTPLNRQLGSYQFLLKEGVCVCWLFFQKLPFKKSFRSTIRVSNGLDPDQNRPDLGLNCLPRLSADDKRSYG